MIFAEIKSELSGTDYHHELVELIKTNFSDVESGLQGDSWVWICDGSDKVEVDTFSSTNHEIKCDKADVLLVKQVIDCLSTQYNVQVYAKPKLDFLEALDAEDE